MSAGSELDAVLAGLQAQIDAQKAVTVGLAQRVTALEDAPPTTTPPPTTPPPTTTPPVVVGPSKIPCPKTAPAGYSLIVAEDFLEPVARGGFPGVYANHKDTRKFGISGYPKGYHDTRYNSAANKTSFQYGDYDLANISVSNSCLTLHMEAPATGPFKVACPVAQCADPGTGRWGYCTYGIFASCWKVDTIPWAKTVPLCWPESQSNENDGEINWPECNLDGSNIMGYCHKADSGTGPVQQFVASTNVPATDGNWHVTELQWDKQRVTYLLDGHKVAEFTGARIPYDPMRWVMQNETKLSGDINSLRGKNGLVLYDWLYVATKN